MYGAGQQFGENMLGDVENVGDKVFAAAGTGALYGALGGKTLPDAQFAMLWVLNLSDGEHSLIDIAETSGLAFSVIAATAGILEEHGLLRAE